jgi:hypothetical protein
MKHLKGAAMPSHRILRALLGLGLVAGCCLLLVVAQGCGSPTTPARETSPRHEAQPQTNVTEPSDTATTEQSEPVKKDAAEETSPAKQDPSKKQDPAQVDAVVAAAKASAGANNPALWPFEVLKVKIDGSWARVDMEPQNKSTDAASWLLQKTDGSWTVVDFGTSIVPEDYPAAPAGVFQ